MIDRMKKGAAAAVDPSITEPSPDSPGEDYYHGMLNAIFTSRGYSPDSNDEAGLGRLDLRVKDRRRRRLLLMEFKRSLHEGDLDADCDEAIGQIIRNGYDKAVPEGYEQQIVYGIAFYGKRARVKCKANNDVGTKINAD